METVVDVLNGLVAVQKGGSGGGGSNNSIGEKRRLSNFMAKQPFLAESRISKRANVSNNSAHHLPLAPALDGGASGAVSDSDTASIESSSTVEDRAAAVEAEDEEMAEQLEASPEQAVATETAEQLKRVPTRSCYVAASRLGEAGGAGEGRLRRRGKSKSLVVFGGETKTWCGLRPERMYLDELVHQFFVLGKQFSSVDVLRLIGLDSALVDGVNGLLKDLCARIQSEAQAAEAADVEDDGVPVLLQGGGRGMKVNSFHHPYLVSLQQVVAEAVGVVSLGFSLKEGAENKNNNADHGPAPASKQEVPA